MQKIKIQILALLLEIVLIPSISNAATSGYARTPSGSSVSVSDVNFQYHIDSFVNEYRTHWRTAILGDSTGWSYGECHPVSVTDADETITLPNDHYWLVRNLEYYQSPTCSTSPLTQNVNNSEDFTVNAVNTYYSCTGENNACIEDENSTEYLNDPTCNSECVAPKYYSCTGTENACIEDAESTEYEDDPTCNSECVAPTHYSCSGIRGACAEDPGGEYSGDPTCNNECSLCPAITTFESQLTSFFRGGSTLLWWEVDPGDATTTLTITPDLGEVENNSSERIYPITDTDYTLTASSTAGIATSTVSITMLTAGETGEEMTPDQADYIIVILTTLTVITGLGLLRGLLQLFTNRR